MITLQSDVGMFLFWLREGLKASTRKLAREMGIEYSLLKALRDKFRKPAIWEVEQMAAYARRMVAEGKIREPRKPYLWNWCVVSPLEGGVPKRPQVMCLKDFYS